MKPIVIFDLDGTLSNHSHRIHLAESEAWDLYHNDAIRDTPHDAAVFLWQQLKYASNMVVCTGRPERFRRTALDWLWAHQMRPLIMLMRADTDHRHNHEVRREQLAIIRSTLGEPHLAIDDQDSVINMYREQGIYCLQCGRTGLR